MPTSRLLVLASLLSAVPACAPRWRTETLVDPREVARALGDPADVGLPPFDPATVPDIAPPKKLRPCCAFGADLKTELGKIPIPLVEIGNLRGPDDLGPHGYDKGDLTREKNGLVYTCRGGFLDIAHVRDHADRALYLSLAIARALPGGVTLELPEEGTLRHITLAPLPPGVLERHGRWTTATALAAWINHQIGNWHETVTWYGFESVKGIAERLSAFSPEDIYSNALGTRIGIGIVLGREARSRDEYDIAMQAWQREALRRLGAVPLAEAHVAMNAVDGLWWDSSKRVPEFELVKRRYLAIDTPIAPWTVADTFPDDPALKKMCAGQPDPLEIVIPEKIGKHAIPDLVTIRFEFTDKWRPDNFPLPAKPGDIVTPADFPKILDDVRRQGAEQLGPDFDTPKKTRPADKPSSDKPADEPSPDKSTDTKSPDTPAEP